MNSISRSIFFISFFVLFSFSGVSFALIQDEMEFVFQRGHKGGLESGAFLRDGKTFVSCGFDGKVLLWDLLSNKELLTYDIIEKGIIVSPDGDLLATQSATGVSVYRRDNLSQVAFFTAGGMAFYPVCFSEDNRYLVMQFGRDRRCMDTVKVFDIKSGSTVFSLHEDGRCQAMGQVSHNNRIIVGTKGKCAVWDIESGRRLLELPFGCYAGAFSPDENYLILANQADERPKGYPNSYTTLDKSNLAVVELSSGKILRRIWNAKGPLAVSKDSKRIYGASSLTGDHDGILMAWDLTSGKVLSELHHDCWIAFISMNADGSEIAVGSGTSKYSGTKGTIRIYDTLPVLAERSILSTGGKFDPIYSIAESPDGRHFMTRQGRGYYGRNIIWNSEYLVIERVCDSGKALGHYNSVAFSPDGKIVANGAVSHIGLSSVITGKCEQKIDVCDTIAMAFHPTKDLLAAGYNGKLIIWNLQSLEKESTLEDFQGNIHYLRTFAFSPDGNYLGIGCPDGNYLGTGCKGTVRLYTFPGLEEVFRKSDDIGKVTFTPDGKHFIYGTDKAISFVNINNKRTDFTFKGGAPFAVSRDGEYFAYSAGGRIIVYDLKNCRKIRSFEKGRNVLTALIFNRANLLISAHDDCTMEIFNIANGNQAYMAGNGQNGGEWILFTPDGYFDASKNGGDLVGIQKDGASYNVDQFALTLNRPDIILERLNVKNRDLLEHYHTQYLKRLERVGLGELSRDTPGVLPEVKLLDAQRREEMLSLNFSLSCKTNGQLHYNIYVNDVPLFRGLGQSVSGPKATISEDIELSNGKNKIEIACTNEHGLESLRAVTYSVCADKKVKPDLYFLGIGVSHFKDPSLDLQYAHKDAEDLAAVMGRMKGLFGHVYVKTLLNEEVIRDRIAEARSFLNQTRVDDVVVLFIAGHGVHGDAPAYTYYYLTHDADLADLAGTAASFDLIENLLDGIPSRNKLFLMDTCESGEIQGELKNDYMFAADNRGIHVRAIRVKSSSDTNSVSTKKRDFLLSRDRYIYNDLIRRTGAIVFSSSKGNQFSYESNKIENGFFTEAILKALFSEKADRDKDNTISTDELRTFVTADVSENTDSLQTPTVDRDNIYNRFFLQKLR